MSDYLVIEWDPQCVRGLDVQVSGGSIQVKHTFEMPQPSGVEQPALKEWFSHLLAEKKISTRQVIMTVPRENVVVRRLELPDVPDEEMPQMVRFQAASKSSLTLDDLSLDFLPLPRREGVPTRDVLLAMVPQTMIAAIREFIDDDKRELMSIRLSSLGTAELVAHLEGNKVSDPRQATLIVARHDQRVEISVTWQRQLIFTHAARLAGETAEQQNTVILTEVSRALMSFQNLNLGFKLAEGYVLGAEGDFPGLAESLQKRLPITVKTINPFSVVKAPPEAIKAVSQQSAYAGMIGAIWSQTHPQIQELNFLAPRKPVVKPDTRAARNRQLAIGGGVAAVALIGAYWFGLTQLDAAIETRANEITQIDDELKKGKPVLDSAKLIDQWISEDVNMLDEMQRLQKQLPGTERIYLTKLSVKTPSSRTPAEITTEGHAREEKDIRELREKLIAPETGYKTSPGEIKTETKEYYPKKLSEQIRIVKPASSKSTASGTTASKSLPQKVEATGENVSAKSADTKSSSQEQKAANPPAAPAATAPAQKSGANAAPAAPQQPVPTASPGTTAVPAVKN